VQYKTTLIGRPATWECWPRAGTTATLEQGIAKEGQWKAGIVRIRWGDKFKNENSESISSVALLRATPALCQARNNITKCETFLRARAMREGIIISVQTDLEMNPSMTGKSQVLIHQFRLDSLRKTNERTARGKFPPGQTRKRRRRSFGEAAVFE
jgi:hypothetical protein